MKTPKGVFKYTHLNKPDTRYDSDGVFSVSVVFDKDDPKVKKMLAALDKLHAEAGEAAEEAWAEIKPAAKKKLAQKKITEPMLMDYYEEELDDNDEPTGNIVMRFKTKSQFTSKKTGKIVKKVVPFYDGKGQMIHDKKRPLVYGGTTGFVDFGTSPVFIPSSGEAYLAFYLNSVMISKLVTSGSAGGGWEADEDSDFDGDELEEFNGGDDDDNGEDLDDDLDDDLDGDENEDDDLDDEIPF
jgi:hypothetical protein